MCSKLHVALKSTQLTYGRHAENDVQDFIRKNRASALLSSLAPLQGTIKEEFCIPSHDIFCIQANNKYLPWKETPGTTDQEVHSQRNKYMSNGNKISCNTSINLTSSSMFAIKFSLAILECDTYN